MANSSGSLKYATTYLIKGQDPMRIRLSDGELREQCVTARSLKAHYFVYPANYNIRDDHPIWGIFDMATAQKDNPHPGVWSINDPKHTFPTEDAAIMFGLVLLGRK